MSKIYGCSLTVQFETFWNDPWVYGYMGIYDNFELCDNFNSHFFNDFPLCRCEPDQLIPSGKSKKNENICLKIREILEPLKLPER